MKEDNTPKLDYWMVEILKASARTEIKRVASGYLPVYVQVMLEKRNQYDELGQLQLILDRLQEIQTHYDEEIKEGLDNGHNR